MTILFLFRKHFKIHKKSVRSIEFSPNGSRLISGSLDKAIKIVDVETSQVVQKYPRAHGSALYKVRPISDFLLATGDEDGTVKLW